MNAEPHAAQHFQPQQFIFKVERVTVLVTDNVEEAAALLKTGKLVAFGTETVYGLGGRALDPLAVAKIFEAKQRPSFDPLIVHLANGKDVDRYVSRIPSKAQLLMGRFWPGPLTVVLPKKAIVPDLVTSGLDSVGIRVPASDMARQLIEIAGVPVAAPSANRFGCISPTTAQHVLDSLGDAIDAVLDCGPSTVGLESTVVTFDADENCVLLRPGGITVEELEDAVGPVVIRSQSTTGDRSQQFPSPGMLTKHYAPDKPMRIVRSVDNIGETATIGVLSFQPVEVPDRFAAVEILSARGDLAEAASNFFSALRRLESSLAREIVATPFPEHGLGIALNDRLKRAAAK